MKNIDNYNFVSFDLDGTLIRPRKLRYIALYYKAFSDALGRYDRTWEKHRQLTELLSRLLILPSSLSDPRESTFADRVFNRLDRLKNPAIRTNREAVKTATHRHLRNNASTQPMGSMHEIFQEIINSDCKVAVLTRPLVYADLNRLALQQANFDTEDLTFVNGWDRSRFPKHTKKYYESVLDRLNINPDNALHVGDDIIRDGAACGAGMDVFLVENEGSIAPKSKYLNLFGTTNRGKPEELREFLFT